LKLEYTNRADLNNLFSCVFCRKGEHGIGRVGKFICFNCIKELVDHHDAIVKPEHKIIK